MSEPVLNLEDVGNRIMSRRKKMGLTQEALAEKVMLLLSLFHMQKAENVQCVLKTLLKFRTPLMLVLTIFCLVTLLIKISNSYQLNGKTHHQKYESSNQ